ncbi:MAG: hypothetical protein ACJ70Z_09595, partial [Nitrososphaera sp.]
DAHGTASSDNQSTTITGGTFQITDINDAQRSVSGSIHRGQFTNNSEGGSLGMIGVVDLVHHFTEPCILEGDMQFAMSSGCSTLNLNYISFNFAVSGNEFGDFHGEVACSQGGGIQSTAVSSQNSDGDGVPDSSHRCLNTSHPRCFKEAT